LKIDGKEKWRGRIRSCGAYIMIEGEESNLSNIHNHGLQTLVKEIRIGNELKMKAVETKESRNNIIISKIKKLTDIEQASLIRIESLKRIATRERMKNVGLDIQKFHDIVETMRSDHQGNKSFLYDSGYDINRFVIYSSEYNKKFIPKSDDAFRVWDVSGDSFDFFLNVNSSYLYIRKNISSILFFFSK
jgi:hypothetical protein